MFQHFGFEVVSTWGSELDTGTLRAIIRHAAAYIPESQLVPHFRAR